MIEEYIRLTNIAFKADSSTPLVFLLDEVQHLGKLTDRQSTFSSQERYHTQLSLLLTQLAVPQSPVCIATGTDNIY